MKKLRRTDELVATERRDREARIAAKKKRHSAVRGEAHVFPEGQARRRHGEVHAHLQQRELELDAGVVPPAAQRLHLHSSPARSWM